MHTGRVSNIHSLGFRALTVVRNFLSHIKHRLVKDRLDQRHTTTASSPCLGTRLYLANGLACAALDVFNDVAFRHVVTRANLSTVVSVSTTISTRKRQADI